MTTLLVDTNLLCLLVAGRWRKQAIREHKRLQIYDEADFHRVEAIIARFQRMIICPHVLAETSNIIRLTSHEAAIGIGKVLASLIDSLDEIALASVAGTRRIEYDRLGLVDAMLLEVASNGGTLLSDDAKLCHAAAMCGYPVVNYNYVRDGALRIEQI